MALVTAKRISAISVELLSRALVLPMTVARVPGEEFTGDAGDTITVRVRNIRTARKQATPGAGITYDALNETPVDVTLEHWYDAARITDEQQSLQLVDFATQVTAPQVASVAVAAENILAAKMNGLAAEGSFATTATEADTRAKLLLARQALSAANVPPGDRFLAAAPDIVNRILSVPDFTRADAMGDGRSSALRDAIVGKVLGFTVVEANGLTAGTALGYHRSGFVFANKAPVAPRGLPSEQSATTIAQGIAMRQVFQYQPDILSDTSVMSSFAGAATVDGNRVFKLDTTAP
ncbi:phage capsid protein [Actinocorallia longicatena]|uniref:P22 coat protein Gp5 n=1 Tax=Actinocorallia longicatena TaxID=111803 RepID=A0ABP6QEI9_9ACTN